MFVVLLAVDGDLEVDRRTTPEAMSFEDVDDAVSRWLLHGNSDDVGEAATLPSTDVGVAKLNADLGVVKVNADLGVVEVNADL